jgi:AraC-like DNA-binding protein
VSLHHETISATSLAEARQQMREACPDLRLTAAEPGFAWSQTLLGEPRFTLRRWVFEGEEPVEVVATPGDEIAVVWLNGGDLSWSSGPESGEGPGAVMLVSGRELIARGRHIDVNVLCLDRSAVAKIARSVYNTDLDTVRFVSALPVSEALATHWRAAAETYRDLLADPILWRTAAVRAAAFRHLAVVTLEAFRQGGDSAGRERAAAGLTDGYVRATMYIDENASLPISDADIAEGSDLSPDELQRAFESHSAGTSADRLREARLAAAHADLLRAGVISADALEVIAKRWGFPSVTEFARHYRARYGAPPVPPTTD